MIALFVIIYCIVAILVMRKFAKTEQINTNEIADCVGTFILGVFFPFIILGWLIKHFIKLMTRW